MFAAGHGGQSHGSFLNGWREPRLGGPATIRVLGVEQEGAALFQEAGECGGEVPCGERLGTGQGEYRACGAINRIGLILCRLGAEPEREPGAVACLAFRQIAEHKPHGVCDGPGLRGRQVRMPCGKGFQRVGGDVGTTSVEGESTPASAESWYAAVPILEIEQPLNGVGRG